MAEERPTGPAAGPDPASETRREAEGLHGGWYFAIASVTVARGVAIALLPPLLVKAPAVLVALSPAAADLVLAAPLMEPWLFFVIGMVAAIAQSAIAFHFGRALGTTALVWLEARSLGARSMTSRLRKWIERAAPLVLLLTPGPTASALAGVSGVRAWWFYPVITVANAAWTIACYVFGSALTEQLDTLYAFIGAHVLELTVVAVTLVGGQTLWARRRRRKAAQRELGG